MVRIPASYLRDSWLKSLTRDHLSCLMLLQCFSVLIALFVVYLMTLSVAHTASNDEAISEY